MQRTFLALDLPTSVREALVREQQALQRQLPAASWVRTHAMHITVKFLGDTPEEQIEMIREAVSGKCKDLLSFVIELAGLGVFPDSKAPRTLWAGISSGQEQLLSLEKDIDEALVPIGFPAEHKPYHPHVTLARIKKDHRQFGLTLRQAEILTHMIKFGSVPVEKIRLYKSELKPGGSIYTPLWDVAFRST